MVAALDVVRDVLAPGDGRRAEYLAVGPPGRPTFLLPRDRRVAAAACRAYNALRPAPVRRRRAAVSAVVGAGLGPAMGGPVVIEGPPVLQDAPPLLDELAEVLGVDDLHAAVGLGEVDEWWTPVLQLFDGAGRPVGFAKVGLTPLTAAMVHNEGRVLESLRRRPPLALTVPRLVARGGWGSAEVVLTAPLPADVRAVDRSLPPQCPLSAHGATTRVVGGRWWDTLSSRLAVGTGSPHDQRVADAVAEVAARLGPVEVPSGWFHGDWVPWNLAVTDGAPGGSGLVAWDWEHAASGVPLGLDDLHGAFGVARHHGTDIAGALSVAVVHGREVLADRDRLDVLALVHPVLVLGRLADATRAGAAPARTAAETADVLAVVERRLAARDGAAA